MLPHVLWFLALVEAPSSILYVLVSLIRVVLLVQIVLVHVVHLDGVFPGRLAFGVGCGSSLLLAPGGESFVRADSALIVDTTFTVFLFFVLDELTLALMVAFTGNNVVGLDFDGSACVLLASTFLVQSVVALVTKKLVAAETLNRALCLLALLTNPDSAVIDEVLGRVLPVFGWTLLGEVLRVVAM